MTSTTTARPLPKATPESAHFWAGTAAGELRLQRCRSCAQAYFPPQPFCPRCLSDDIEVFRASGRATLYSYVISRLAVPGFASPLVLAVVELEEGPRLLTNIVGVAPEPEQLPLDLPLEVVFDLVDGVALPLFQPRPPRREP
jgi:uncharacterized OB-fold protein